MTPPPERRRRTIVKLTEPFGTIKVQRIEERLEPASDEQGGVPAEPKWQKSRVLWSIGISPLAIWNAVKWLGGGWF